MNNQITEEQRKELENMTSEGIWALSLSNSVHFKNIPINTSIKRKPQYSK